MPRDLSDLLAEGAPRDPGSPDLDAIEARAARRRSGRIGATVVGVLAALAIAVQTWPTAPETPIIDEVEDGVVQDDGTTVLPLPAPGEVLPGHANGRPVFVIHAGDGDVRVLDAINPHDPYPGAMKVLAYCASSGWFEDPWHGSKFSDNGAWVGGPAPYGLATHEVVEVGADTVTVGRLGSAPARGILEGTEPVGPHCGGIGEPEEAQLDDIVLHVDATDTRVPGLLYPERPDGCCGFLLPDEPQVPVAEDRVSIVLPGPDELVARHVGDRPAFLVPQTGDDGIVRVTAFDSINPHLGFGPTVLTVCTGATVDDSSGSRPDPWGVVYDPWYLSTFSPVGRIVEVDGVQRSVPAGGWTGGPAPTGLARFPVLEVQPGTGSSIEVTVLAGTLPPPPRVDMGGDDADAQETRTIEGDVPTEGCSGRDQLFPDMPPADPTLLDDLVLHEPLYPDLWWYPTPARLLGDEPGLPPEELERYLADVSDGRALLDLDDLPAMGDAGLAVGRDGGVEFLDLQGNSLGLLLGVELVDDARDGHGGALLLRANLQDAEHWVAPSNGTATRAEGIVPAGFERFIEQPDGTWSLDDPFFPPLATPLHVGNGGRLVTGPRCDGADCPAPTRIDLDMGGVGTTLPGCVGTDGFADFNLLEVCNDADGSYVRGLFVEPAGEVRFDRPRYPDQPDDSPTIGRITDAVFGGPRIVAQLSLECEVPMAIGFDDDGAPVNLFGGDVWSEPFVESVLLGTVPGLGPLVQVRSGPCSEPTEVAEGIWAIGPDGPTLLLPDVTEPVALWTDVVPDLDDVAAGLSAVRQARNRVCDEPALEDVSGDGLPDATLWGTGTDAIFVCVDGLVASASAAGPLEAGASADLDGDGDVELLIGGTSASRIFLGAVDWRDGALRTIGDGTGGQLGLTRGIDLDEGSWWALDDWGCRDGAGGRQVVQVDIRRRVDVAEVSIRVVEVRDGVATLVDERTEERAPGGEDMAAQVLRELGSEPAFTQSEQRGCLPAT